MHHGTRTPHRSHSPGFCACLGLRARTENPKYGVGQLNRWDANGSATALHLPTARVRRAVGGACTSCLSQHADLSNPGGPCPVALLPSSSTLQEASSERLTAATTTHLSRSTLLRRALRRGGTARDHCYLQNWHPALQRCVYTVRGDPGPHFHRHSPLDLPPSSLHFGPRKCGRGRDELTVESAQLHFRLVNTVSRGSNKDL